MAPRLDIESYLTRNDRENSSEVGKRKTLLQKTSTEQLINLAWRTSMPRVIDKIMIEMERRYSASLDPGDEIYVEFIRTRQFEIYLAKQEVPNLKAMYALPANEELELIEEVNIALFKPIEE